MRLRQVLLPITFCLVALLAVVFARPGPLLHFGPSAEQKQARSQVDRWADQLDRQTTETGAYVRHPREELPAADPWGRPLTVGYSQGGLAEVLTVRSLGPDGQSHTEDDVVASRQSMTLAGVGEGVKKNTEPVVQQAARGLVKGTADGVKEELKGAFGKLKP
jgi:hypothetical protein